jgi:hypothetical protein
MNDNRATIGDIDATDDNARHAIEAPVLRLATAPRWLSGSKAAATLGVSLRTLQRNAASGTVERTLRGRCSLYLVSAPVIDATDDTTMRATIGDINATDDNTRHERHDTRQPDPTVIDLTVRLADAERRAAVAEYRAEIAETDPEVVEELRARVVELEEHASNMEAERDMAHTQGQALADAMRKRHGLVW